MSDHFWLSKEQLARIEPYFPLSHGVPRVDDRRVLSGIIHVLKRGLQWRDAPPEYGPHKTLYNRFVRWSRMGVFDRIFKELSSQDEPDQLQIDATHLKAHRSQPAQKGGVPRDIGRTKGGLNSKLHAVCDGHGRPVLLHLTAGQVSDYTGARKLLGSGTACRKRGSCPVFLPRRTESAKLLMMKPCINNVIRSKTCSEG